MDNEDLIPLDDDRTAEREDAGPADDTFELELDGETHTLPGALKGAFLRQADYTRKTQELAEHRRALAADRDALDRAVAAHRNASGAQLQLMAMDQQLAEFQGVDWDAYAAQDPEQARTLWDAYQQIGTAREQLAQVVAHHGERAELDKARRHAEGMAAAGRQLAEDVEGWSPEVAAKLVDYAAAFGVSPQELAHAADPRLWKLLHRAWRADTAEQASAREQAQTVRPAVSVAGGGAGGTGVRDELATREWMRRRNDQMTRGR